MKGVIALCLKEVVVEHYGADQWQAIVAHAGHSKDPMILPIADIDDQVVIGLLTSTCQVLNISLEQATDAFGDHWVNVYSQKMYRAYYDGARSAREMLLKMDDIHVMVTRHIPGSHPPRFEYEWEDEKTLIMKYKSERGLIDLLVGLIRGIGKLYRENLTVTKLSSDRVRVVFS